MKQIVIVITLISLSLTLHAQGFIGETENQIRADFKENPNAEFHVDYNQGKRYLTAVDNKAQITFMFNSKGACCFSTMWIYDKETLERLVNGFDKQAVVISKGARWRSVHTGYNVEIELSYSTKRQANSLTFYSNELH